MNVNQGQAKQQKEQKQGLKKQLYHVNKTGYRCSNCGASYTSTDKFCSECGTTIIVNACVRCGAATEVNWEICPQCGQNLHAECCSFCGAFSNCSDVFCTECGNPKKGIICPVCQTLNFRSFCRKCNTPLNALAQEAMRQIEAKPEFKKALSIAEDLAVLEDYLRRPNGEEVVADEIQELSDENRAYINQYKELLAVIRGQVNKENTEKQISKKKEPKPRKTFSIKISSKEEALAQYNAKLQEMKETLNALIPEPAMTPQMQRNYYTAVKIEIMTKTKVKVGWQCNAYGCFHEKPNDCTEPFQGGTWIYEERDTTIWVKPID